LRNVLSIRVLSEMTPAQAATATKNVQYVDINATTSYIPSGMIPLPPSVN